MEETTIIRNGDRDCNHVWETMEARAGSYSRCELCDREVEVCTSEESLC